MKRPKNIKRILLAMGCMTAMLFSSAGTAFAEDGNTEAYMTLPSTGIDFSVTEKINMYVTDVNSPTMTIDDLTVTNNNSVGVLNIDSISAETIDGWNILSQDTDFTTNGMDAQEFSMIADGSHDMSTGEYTEAGTVDPLSDDVTAFTGETGAVSAEIVDQHVANVIVGVSPYEGDGSGEGSENEDPYGFSHMLFASSQAESTSDTFFEKSYAQAGDVLAFSVVAYYNNGEIIPINSENTTWEISAKEGTLAEGTTIENGTLTISPNQEPLSVIDIDVSYTDKDGVTHTESSYVMVGNEDFKLSAEIEKADAYMTGSTYKITATAETVSGETVPMEWTYDAFATEPETYLDYELDTEGNFTPYDPGEYTINVWSEYLFGKSVSLAVTVEGDSVYPDDGGDDEGMTVQYTVTLDGNGGSSDEITTTAEELWANLPDNGRDGYQFDGWYTELEGGDLVDENYVLESDTTFYAHWTPNTYYIRYDANGGEGEMDGSDLRYDESFNLTENAYTKTGYAFNGWNTDPDGYGDMYADMASVKNLTENLNEEIVLYAQWKEAEKLDGLFDAEGNQLASWDELVNDYGMDVSKGYTYSTYKTDTASPYYVLTNNIEFSSGVELVIPDDSGVSEIGSRAFADCTNLKSLKINEGITSIGDWAFLNVGLTSIGLPDSLESIGQSSFNNTNLQTLLIPDNVNSIKFHPARGCDTLTEIIVGENNESYSSIDGVLFNKEKTTLVAYPCGKADDSYIVPESVTELGMYSIEGNDYLESVSLPSGLLKIGGYAFCESGITSIVIPDKVTTIENGAFEECPNLSIATIGSSVALMKAPFYDCPSLVSVTFIDTTTWYTSCYSDLSSATKMTVTNTSTNATNLSTQPYESYTWFKE